VILNEVPPIRWNRFTYLLARLFPRLARWHSAQRQSRLQGRLNALMNACARCQDRTELERLLGTPQRLSGNLYAEIKDEGECRPDFVDRYGLRGLWIELWFVKDRVVKVIGSVQPTTFDIAAAFGRSDRTD
jgi:hypothetical protein